MTSWIDEFPERIAGLERALVRRRRRVVVPESGARVKVDGHSMVAFCSNDYLGLAGHPVLVQAACAGAREFGVGAGASPLVSGHSAANAALEHDLAAFTQLPRALYFYAGYAANIGIVPALVGPGDALFSDTLNHACLIDGARLSGAHIHRYAHADIGALATALARSPARRKLVISDAVFSMDGDIADVPAMLALCERHDALLLLDDAHGFGVLGPQGRGCVAHFGLTGARASRRVLYMATLGKAAGVAGAFVAGDDALVEWLLQKTRSYIYATAAPPLLASALQASLRLIEDGQSRRDHLLGLIARLRSKVLARLRGTPWRLGESVTAVQALVIGSNEEALAVMDGLQARGLWVPAIRPPTVPDGTARLRIALSAAHSEADVDRLVEALAELAAQPATRTSDDYKFHTISGVRTMSNLEQPVTPGHNRRCEAAVRAASSHWTVDEVLALFELPFPELMHQAQTVHREHFDPTLIEFATLLSVKTGGCTEDCGYCPQSVKHDTGVEASKLMEPAQVLQAAQRAKDAGATRFCMGAAWRGPKDRDIEKVAELVSTVKALGLETCATLGMLEDGHAQTLRDAGLDYYNHNLDSAPDFYGHVITTRDYQDRLDTLGRVRSAGIKVCCGGIVGMGESRLQRAGLIAQLANLDPYPESVPINHLVRVAGTPLADQAPLDPFEFVRTIAVARITMPRARVRLSAGRQQMGDAVQALCFLAGANSIFYGDKLLTTGNPDTQADLDLLQRLGLRQGQPEPGARGTTEA